ncbi:MAG: pyruvate formate lyase-activating protein [Acholeplasmatales bacterium]|jgi:pyruvate formate lyase activating enzyme|nr:pyruvate formate lyase-activating protein [Acholeplasmatales bacterium]
MDKLLGNIHSIENFGTVDGPGVRMVVFFQGCFWRCLYCHNRDTWDNIKRNMMTTNDILTEYNKYSQFYKNGGITVSGGEPLLQIDFLIELFKLFKKHNIHTCIDTSAQNFQIDDTAKIDELLKYTDLILLDVKEINDTKHKIITGFSNTNTLSFLEYLNKKHISTIIRYVLVPGYSDDINDINELNIFLKTYNNIVNVDVLPYHKNGILKWNKLNIKYPLEDVNEPSNELITKYKNILNN